MPCQGLLHKEQRIGVAGLEGTLKVFPVPCHGQSTQGCWHRAPGPGSADSLLFLLQPSAPKANAVTVKKPEAEGSTPHRVSITDTAQVTWWLPRG